MSTTVDLNKLSQAIVTKFFRPTATLAIDDQRYKKIGQVAHLVLKLTENRRYPLNHVLDHNRFSDSLRLDVPLKTAFTGSNFMMHVRSSLDRHLSGYNVELELMDAKTIANDLATASITSPQDLLQLRLQLNVKVAALNYCGATKEGVLLRHLFSPADFPFFWDSCTPSASGLGPKYL